MKFIFCILAVSIFSIFLHGQNIGVQKYTSSNGLNSELVKSVTADEEGFIYAATDEGLFSFDGKTFNRVEVNPSHNRIKHIFKSRSGEIYFSEDMGIYSLSGKYPNATTKLIAQGSIEQQNNSLWYPKLFFEDSKNRLWISDNHQIFRLTEKNLLLSSINKPILDTENVQRSFIIFEDENGTLWAFYGKGIVYRYDEQRQEFIKTETGFSFRVHHVIPSKNGNHFLATNQGLYEINTSLKHYPEILRKISDLEFSWLVRLNNELYLGGTWKDGLFYIDQKESSIRVANTKLNIININHLFVDNQKNIWAATDDGIQLIQFRIFETVGSQNIKSYIQDIFEDSDGSIWFSSGKSLFKMQEAGIIKSALELLSADGSQEFLRIAKVNNQLILSDNQGKILSLTNNSKKTKPLYEGGPGAIFILEPDLDGNIWFCQDSKEGVLKLTPNNTVIHYTEAQGINTRAICVKTDTQSGKVYIGGTHDDSYLYQYEPKTDKLTNISRKLDFKHNIDITINDICIESSNKIWLATTFGLLLYQNNKVSRVNLGESTENTIKGLDLNTDGSLWLSLSTGMIRFHNGIITHFAESEGLPIKTMTYRAVVCDKMGNVWTGSIAGLAVADALELPITTPVPHLWKIEINGKITELQNGQIFRLNKKSYARLSFSTPCYPGDLLQYQYRFINKDKESEWLTMENPLEIFPGSISNGRKTIEVRVKQAGNFLWSPSFQLDMRLSNIWYESVWFWAILLVFFIVASIVIFRYRIRLARISEIRLQKEISDRTREVQMQKIHILDQKSDLQKKKDILEKVNAELMIAKQKAENLADAKSQFLSNMSHELRTPMNAVIGMTYIMMSEDPKPEQIENLNTLRFSAENLLALINDILDFSKIDAGKISFEEADFDIRDKVNSVLQVLRVKAAEKGVELKMDIDEDIPGYVIGDPTRFNQVLFNLIGNALKFTSKGSVSVKIELQNHTDSTVVIKGTVKDTGIGIPADRLELIFKTFAQADNEISRIYGGTGLGLAITRKLLELQEGSIHVESQVGKGSTFTFIIPYKVSEKTFSDSPTALWPEFMIFNQEKVLLVDDNQINLIVARKFLTKWNLDVDTAENGVEAFNKATQNEYRLIFMDIQMPEMDGATATRKIREYEHTHNKPKTPIIALTASALMEVKNRLIKEGMNDFVTKPFNPTELNYKVSRYINQP